MKVLITGAGSGIGLLTALVLAERHHYVYLATHTQKEADKVKKLIHAMHYDNADVIKADITISKDCDFLMKIPFDCLINNAAQTIGGSVLNADIEQMRRVYEVNLFSSFSLVQKAYQKFKENHRGRIVIMSSLTALAPVPFLGIYSSSKAAISSLVTTLRNENKFLDDNISFTLIEPGMYHTGFNQYMISYILDDQVFKNNNYDIYKLESAFFQIFEKRKLTSIVSKIVKAVEDKNPKKVYRAPFLQSLFCKLYNIIK